VERVEVIVSNKCESVELRNTRERDRVRKGDIDRGSVGGREKERERERMDKFDLCISLDYL